MLELLHIKDFQCHADLILEFSPTITTIAGRNDFGKTAILRSLRWLAMNRPDGDSFIRWPHLPPRGNKIAGVTLKVDGHSITRMKGKGTNCYVLDGNNLNAVQRGEVPFQISSLLNIGEVNFARQHDLPYWLSSTPGQVSRDLNAIVNLEVIDSALANVSAELRKAKAELSVAEQRLQEAEQQKEALSWVPEMVEEWKAVDRVEVERVARSLIVGELEQTVEGLTEAETACEIDVPDLSGLETIVQKIQDTKKRANGVYGMVLLLEAAEEAAAASARRAAGAERELSDKLKGKCPVCGGEI